MANKDADLAIVTDLFDRISMDHGGSAELFGVWSKNRDDLIQEVADQTVRFQTVNGLSVIDGVIDPGGRTIHLMNKFATDRLLTPMPGDPGWEDWGYKDLPQLSNYKVPEIVWEMTFGAPSPPRAMSTRAYVCDAAMRTPHVGIAWPAGVTKPSAYLIYFHHSIGQEGGDYATASVRFKKGIGDYLIGRMRGMDGIAASGTNVCMVVPEPTFGQPVFETDDKLTTEALKEIDADLCGETRDLPPILAASYSDGLGRMNNFKNNCTGLSKMVRGVYDFDGLYVTRYASITLTDWAKAGAKVFRYVGNSHPQMLPKETQLAYLSRCMNLSTRVIPLQKERWVNHPHYREFETDAGWAAKWWMHFYIPSCMLAHGLANTDGI